jgi:intracellular septation protein
VLNELVWRHVSTKVWVSFKAFGFLPLTFLFALAQVPLMQRHGEPEAGGPGDPEKEKRA